MHSLHSIHKAQGAIYPMAFWRTKSGLLCLTTATKHWWRLDNFSHRKGMVGIRKRLVRFSPFLQYVSCYTICSRHLKVKVSLQRCLFPMLISTMASWCNDKHVTKHQISYKLGIKKGCSTIKDWVQRVRKETKKKM